MQHTKVIKLFKNQIKYTQQCNLTAVKFIDRTVLHAQTIISKSMKRKWINHPEILFEYIFVRYHWGSSLIMFSQKLSIIFSYSAHESWYVIGLKPYTLLNWYVNITLNFKENIVLFNEKQSLGQKVVIYFFLTSIKFV